MPPYTAVVFDMDGLLVDTEILYCEALTAQAAAMGFDLTMDVLKRMIGHSWAGSTQVLKAHFGDAFDTASTYLGQNFVVVKPDSAIPVLEYLKLEADFDYLVDVTAVDWPKRAERFDLVYILI